MDRGAGRCRQDAAEAGRQRGRGAMTETELMVSGAGAGLTATRRINCRAAACTLMRPAACRDVAQQGKRRICDPLLLPAMSCYINGLRDVVGGFGTGMALASGSVASIGMTRTG